jgi:hypothetical protein
MNWVNLKLARVCKILQTLIHVYFIIGYLQTLANMSTIFDNMQVFNQKNLSWTLCIRLEVETNNKYAIAVTQVPT